MAPDTGRAQWLPVLAACGSVALCFAYMSWQSDIGQLKVFAGMDEAQVDLDQLMTSAPACAGPAVG